MRSTPRPAKNTRRVSHAKSPMHLKIRRSNHTHAHSQHTIPQSEIVITKHPEGTHVHINRPKKLNALDLPATKQLYSAIQQFHRDQLDPNAPTMFLSGAGPKSFCAGGDILWLYNQGLSWHTNKEMQGLQANREFFRHAYFMHYMLSELPRSHSILNGITLGGGSGLGIHTKISTSTEKTLWAMPEAAIGFFPDVGSSHVLSRIQHETGDAMGMFLALTGTRLKGHDLVHLGIAHQFVESKYLPHVLPESPETMPSGHETLDWQNHIIPRQDLPALSLSPSQLDCIVECFRHDSVEQIIEALHKYRTQDRSFADQTAHLMHVLAPISLKVTHEMLRRAKTMTVAQCLSQDHHIAGHLLALDDFYIGVKNVLIDKKRDTRAPWSYEAVSKVPDTLIAKIFDSNPSEDFVPEPMDRQKIFSTEELRF